MRVFRAALCFSCLAFVCLSFAQKGGAGNLQAITQARLKAHLEFIANDLLEGRDTPSRGLNIAAQYIAAQLKLWGVEPGGPGGSYFQSFPIKEIGMSSASSLSIGGTQYRPFSDFQPNMTSGSASGQLVFVGYGFRTPSKGIDPYKDVDAWGKIVVRMGATPTDWNWQDFFQGKIPGAEPPEAAAMSHGALAILTLPDKRQEDNWIASGDRLRSLRVSTVDEFGSSLPAVTLSAETANALLKGTKQTLSDLQMKAGKNEPLPAFAMDAKTSASIDLKVERSTISTQNVVGIVRGSDPKLKAEFVACGAHYDHVGTGDGPGDQIYNGADDDGSGTVSILELAHAFSTGPKPKRSIIFVWHAGEEKGLWGSDYFTNHTTVPRAKIVCQLNIDMIGRSKPAGNTDPRNKMLTGPDSVYVIGSRMLSDDLGDVCVDVNRRLYKLNFDYHYDAPNDPEQMYSRSDHYNYARFGIPIAFFFDGVHEDYHQVSDEVQKIDFRKMERVARTVFEIAWTISNQSSRPKVNKKASQ
jgi:hypothetical protein